MDLLDRYFDAEFEVPGFIVQPVLDGYLDLYHKYDRLTGTVSTSRPPETDAIADQSRELMETHYDMPLALFENFLDSSLKYSMGLWATGARTLDDAQEAMVADLCAKMGLEDGQRVLDVGCGFGSFAHYVLRHYPNAKVTGLTLSRTQADYMRAKQAEDGHPFNTDRFSLIEDDFNDVSFDQRFDRVVSIGVFEHVTNLTNALAKLREFVAEGGRLMLHYIVYRPHNRDDGAARQNPFIAKYIFPGGRIWSDQELYRHQRDFVVEKSWFLDGRNYQRTIEAWLANFHRNYGRIRRNSGLSRRHLKIWEFYLRACIAVFKVARGQHYGNGQYVLVPR